MTKKPAQTKKTAPFSTNIFFGDNTLLPALYGEDEAHLKKLETMLSIQTVARGNMVSLSGVERDVILAEEILNDLYARLEKGVDIGPSEVAAAIRMAPPVNDADVARKKSGGKVAKTYKDDKGDIVIKTMKKTIRPYTHMQANYMRIMYDNDLVFALGPAGTGKTYIAVAMAVYAYLQGKVEKIILSRPAVEAGEKLGFLPGDVKEKIDPFLRPLYDALFDMLPPEKVTEMSENGEIEVAPLAFMRGRTLSNAFVILDEAQNTTPTQMKMFLTRLGENSHMVITGDLSQTDLPKDIKSGLRDAIRKVEHIEGIGSVLFSDGDVVRHELAARIVKAYNDWDNGVRPSKYDNYINQDEDEEQPEDKE
jgi:phosphate starvation-inducible PhoH-like protein